ncbi:NADH-quinone oxidoreductase subunit K [Testudinibacter sp. TR-2022]|uniref:NADH-quinone oxidoreductase subunit K n=1 Tax=Testudinibacter sp. TR-2022 TaxID=2585029 RepID=UPI00111BC5D8|nr:NADH-quinone oxidoreductase subunit K [Testudinibacter sp. TR-2022]TNH08025.1 cation:proton antiporter [Pasteurellaceae bacterium Phil11]TNH19165.1 cation:proton antiporter [Testudinibacter sp. TR-2022]TNH22939.1 cation:proton antiporter [Testudinibacter sp. TR-2022]
MTLVILITLWITLIAAIYLLLSRHALRIVIGLMLLGNAVNFIILLSGRVYSTVPAVVPLGQDIIENPANPLPQALILTAIVIGFALTCFSVVLMIKLIKKLGTDDINEWREAEPLNNSGHKPAIHPDHDDDGGFKKYRKDLC